MDAPEALEASDAPGATDALGALGTAGADRSAPAPIAIVGMAGRFPGANHPEELWELLAGRGFAIRPVPAERWDASARLDPARSVQAVGGFLEGVREFDADFFGISPREAAAIDPQQRLMLEYAWRALEDAGQRSDALAGSRTGVYVGASWRDYELQRIAGDAPPTPHSLVGNALDVIAARVSYFLKLRGPSMTVETGCSSSLVALHLAVQALRAGQIGAAIVGGTNLMLNPFVTVGLTHFGALSPDGRCAAFGAGANGFVRGEGVAALYLKTLERALADGDRIHAVVAATAVNNDGGGDSLVTPSFEGQEDLLRQIYDDAGLPAGAPLYVEAHGTGTDRGDPIEARALGEVIGRRRPGPLYVGSVKTNIGHLEASAGLAGLFKLVLALRHGAIPPSLHSATLNPSIEFGELNLSVVRETLPLPDGEPVYLGLNSFGWGGTNAHVLLRSAPEPAAAPSAPQAPETGLPALVPLSARQGARLRERAAALASACPAEPRDLAAVAGTLAWRRDHFAERAALVAADPADLPAMLAGLAASAEADAAAAAVPGVTLGRAVPAGRVAFVFPGQGSQWSGMGRDLYRDSPLFASVVRRCAEALRPHVDWDPLAVFAGTADDTWMSRIDMLQPTLWTMSLGLAELWRAAGVVPDVVLGHSQGEITAATFSGILSYEDGALIVARRSAIARRTSGRGRMLLVDLDPAAAREALLGFEDEVALAVHNGPTSCVLSGAEDSVLALKEILDAEGTFCRLVNVDYASHSPQMEELREDLLVALDPVAPRAGAIAMLSTARVAPLQGPEMQAPYWVENLRNPVLFADTLTMALDQGVTHVVEISPHPVLAPAIEQLGATRPQPPAVLTSLRRDTGSVSDFAGALAAAYVAGLEPFGTLPRRMTDAPGTGYPLHGDVHWIPERAHRPGARHGFDPRPEPVPGDPAAWTAELTVSTEHLPFLNDHRVLGTPVLPAAAMLVALAGTARRRLGRLPRSLGPLSFPSAVGLGEEPARLAVHWSADAPNGAACELLAAAGDDGSGAAWRAAATARVDTRPAEPADDAAPGSADEHDESAAGDFYRVWEERGLEYGPAFRTIRTLHLGEDGATASGWVEVAGEAVPGLAHPALWDGVLQTALPLAAGAGDGAVVPVSIQRLSFHADPEQTPTRVWALAARRADGLVDVRVFDPGHRALMTVEGLRLSPLAGGADGVLDQPAMHRLVWEETEPAAAGAPARVRVVSGGTAADVPAAALRTALGAAAVGADDDADTVVFVAPGASAGVAAQEAGLALLTDTVRACLNARGAVPAVAVLTAGAAAVAEGDTPDPGAALYWGYTRVLRREHPELAARLIDVAVDTAAGGPSAGDLAALVAELAADHGEDQVALRAGRRLAARLDRGLSGADDAAPAPGPAPRRQPFRIQPPDPARRVGPRPVPLVRQPPAPGDLEVVVDAVTLDASGSPARAFAGRVGAVGPDASGWRTGDPVVALAWAPVGSHAAVPAVLACPVPAGLDSAAAAAAAVSTVVAWHALAAAARVAEGETVFVHYAPGGLGQALARVAAFLGARVILGLPSGRLAEHLRQAQDARDAGGTDGAPAAVDTDDPAWTAAVLALTGGRGADVVVSPEALAGALRGAAALADDGRLVALGAGVQRPAPGTAAPALPERPVTLVAVDVPALIRDRPAVLAEAMMAVWELVSAGKIEPPAPVTAAFAALPQALRTVLAAGPEPVVLTDPDSLPGVPPAARPDGRLRPDAAYLVSGGLGALGLSLAERMAADGAGTWSCWAGPPRTPRPPNGSRACGWPAPGWRRCPATSPTPPRSPRGSRRWACPRSTASSTPRASSTTPPSARSPRTAWRASWRPRPPARATWRRPPTGSRWTSSSCSPPPPPCSDSRARPPTPRPTPTWTPSRRPGAAAACRP